MTANAMEEDRLRAIAAGVDAHIAKPIDVDELIITLTRFAKPVTPAASSSPVPSPAPTGDDRPQALEGIDLNAALARMGGNYPAFVSLLKRFERSQGASVAEINQLLKHEKRHGADQVLHRVKGVAANLGAREIADLCAEAQAALADDDDGTLQTLLRALESAIARLTATARALPEPEPAQASGAVNAGALADLLSLLRNSNMRAIAAFKSLRGAIEGEYPDLAPALNEAIDTLDFTAAEHLVKEMLKRREWA
jgi:HPt (histidine-containing phosphotransfer) domain-containing protein